MFAGFLPRENKKLKAALDELRSFEGTVIFYEAPHRLRKTLAAVHELWGDRPAAVVRELTKKHEEVIRGTLAECIDWFASRESLGEICLLVEAPGAAAQDDTLLVGRHFDPRTCGLLSRAGVDRKESMKMAAADRGLSKREIYQAF